MTNRLIIISLILIMMKNDNNNTNMVQLQIPESEVSWSSLVKRRFGPGIKYISCCLFSRFQKTLDADFQES